MSSNAWTFRSEIVTPSGIAVEVSMFIPESVAWPDVPEGAELAQMTANAGLKNIQRSIDYSAERAARIAAEQAEEAPF